MKNIELKPRLEQIACLRTLNVGGDRAIKIAHNKKKIHDAFKIFQEVLINTRLSFCDKDDSNNPIIKDKKHSFSEENEILLEDALKKLLDTESDVKLEKISMEGLEKLKDATPDQMDCLLWINEQ